jgi:hypothetical protein
VGLPSAGQKGGIETFDSLSIEMISEMLGGNVLVRSDNESVVLVILDMIISSPQGDDAPLKVVGIDDSNGMEVDRQFNS